MLLFTRLCMSPLPSRFECVSRIPLPLLEAEPTPPAPPPIAECQPWARRLPLAVALAGVLLWSAAVVVAGLGLVGGGGRIPSFLGEGDCSGPTAFAVAVADIAERGAVHSRSCFHKSKAEKKKHR
jgi:hypothetical protein